MAMILKTVFSLSELKIIATLVLFVTGVTFLVKKQEPKLIREMKIEPLKRKELKRSVGVLTILAALLYPAEVCLSMIPVIPKDFIELFWGVGLVVVSLILMLLINYYQKMK